MRRIQLHLDEDVDEALAVEATRRGVAKAALIREYLSAHVQPKAPQVDDPSTKLIGAYGGEEGESSSVDDVVYRQ